MQRLHLNEILKVQAAIDLLEFEIGQVELDRLQQLLDIATKDDNPRMLGFVKYLIKKLWVEGIWDEYLLCADNTDLGSLKRREQLSSMIDDPDGWGD